MKKISKQIILGAFVMICSIIVNAQTKWNPDNVHSSIRFTATHLVIAEVEGNFKTFSGSMEASKPDFTDAKIEFTADVSSISTNEEKRDAHLKSDDFFNAEKYPKITFKSTSFKKVKGNKYLLKGDLTIRDITKPVTFDVTYNGTIKDPWGNTRAGFKAETTINRFDYNLKWNALMEAGGAVVGKDIQIKVNVEFIPQK